MNISLYDLLSKLIPGGLALFIVSQIETINYEGNSEIITLIVVYVIGYLIETVASLLERPVIFKLFLGNPFDKLIEGESFLQISLSNVDSFNEYVQKYFPKIKNDNLKIFGAVYSEINQFENKRVSNFLNSYVFSRNIMVSFFLGSVAYLLIHFSWSVLGLCLICLLIFFVRCKQRNYYFVKEVIESYVALKGEN